MALANIYDLATGDNPHRATVGGAIITAAFAIINEAADAPNHANRLVWAWSVINDPQAQQERIFRYMLTNSTLLADFTAEETPPGTDGDVQYVVNSLVSDAAMLARIMEGGDE